MSERKADLDLLFGVADGLADKSIKAALSNLIAEAVMGWRADPSDSRRLWRDANKQPIVRVIDGKSFYLCQHPWLPGVNLDDDRSFDPAFNYHAKQIDWRRVVAEHLASGY